MIEARIRDPEAGITLIEVLVGMALFAMIGLAGFTMLDSILRVQSRTEDRLERLASIDRALVVFSRDLQQSDPNSVKLDANTVTMFRSGAGPLVYNLESSALKRRLPRADFDQPLVSNVVALQIKSLDTDGNWHEVWPIEWTQSLGLPPTLKAIELDLELPEGSVSRLVDVPSGAGG